MRHRDRMSPHPAPLRQPPQQRLHPRRQRRLTQPAQRQVRQGHPQLHRRQNLIDMVLQAQGGARRRPVARHQVLHMRLAHTHQGELRSHEKAVRQDAQRDQTSMHQQPVQHVPQV